MDPGVRAQHRQSTRQTGTINSCIYFGRSILKRSRVRT